MVKKAIQIEKKGQLLTVIVLFCIDHLKLY